jgi:hypothetical protein
VRLRSKGQECEMTPTELTEALNWIENEHDRLLEAYACSEHKQMLDEISSFREACKRISDSLHKTRHEHQISLQLYDLARDRTWYWLNRERSENEFSDALDIKKLSGSSVVSDEIENEIENMIKINTKSIDWLGYEPSKKSPLNQGSWWQRTIYVIKNTVSHEGVQDRAKAVEDALFGAKVVMDQRAAEMISDVVGALTKSKAKSALIDAGKFLFIKTIDDSGEPSIYVKKITLDDRIIIDENPEILRKPDAIIKKLDQIKKINLDRLEEIEEQSKLLTGSKYQKSILHRTSSGRLK